MGMHWGKSTKRITTEPDLLDDPKRHLVDLARISNRTEIRASIVPRPGSGRRLAILRRGNDRFRNSGHWRINTGDMVRQAFSAHSIDCKSWRWKTPKILHGRVQVLNHDAMITQPCC